jgi:hypothetical protein
MSIHALIETLTGAKRFFVCTDRTLLSLWFLNNSKVERFISVVSYHLSVSEVLEKGYVFESNIAHAEPYTNGFICHISEYFSTKKIRYSDSQTCFVEVTVRDKNIEIVNSDEIVGLNGDSSDVSIERFDSTRHNFKYRLRLELVLEFA